MVMMCRLAKSIVELLTCAMPSWKGCFTWYEMNGRFWDRIAMQANKLPTDTNQTHKRTIFWITHVFKHQKFALQLKLQVYHYTSLPFSKTNIWITQDNYRKTSNKARGSYSFLEAQNAGLIRNWAFLPIELKNYCGSY